MTYAFTDNEGNTHLLGAAQPRNFQDRSSALDELKYQVNAGTYIIQKIESTQPVHYLFGSLDLFDVDGNVTFDQFEEVTVNWHPEIIFEFLGINRAAFVKILTSIANDAAYNKIAPEILMQLSLGNLKAPNADIANVTRTYIEKKKESEQFFEKAKSFLKNSDAISSPSELIEILKDRNKIHLYSNSIELATQLESIESDLEKTRTHALQLCRTQEAFSWYLSIIQNSQIPVGYLLFSFFASCINFPIIIWNKSEDLINAIEVQIEGQGKRHVVNFLFKDYFKFNLLHKSDLNKTNAGPSFHRLELIKIHRPLEEKNIFRDNLLHRAVRCPSADLLVPYLIYELKFNVNEKNIYGKTALHRAIRYFGEFKQELLRSMDEKTFFDIALSCFSTLIKAGADINAEDNSKDTPLKRAAAFDSAFKPSHNTNFSLKKWILEEKQKYSFPTQQVSQPIANTQMLPPITNTQILQPAPITQPPQTIVEPSKSKRRRTTEKPPAPTPTSTPKEKTKGRSRKKTNTEKETVTSHSPVEQPTTTLVTPLNFFQTNPLLRIFNKPPVTMELHDDEDKTDSLSPET